MTQPSPAEDLATLAPEQALAIGGETVTVRPFGFIEGLRLHALAAPIVNGLAAMAEAGGEAGQAPDAEADFDRLAALFGEHEAALVSLMALSTGKPEAWIRALDDADGQALLMLFWVIQKDFFMRRLLSRAMVRRVQRARPNSSAP